MKVLLLREHALARIIVAIDTGEYRAAGDQARVPRLPLREQSIGRQVKQRHSLHFQFVDSRRDFHLLLFALAAGVGQDGI